MTASEVLEQAVREHVIGDDLWDRLDTALQFIDSRRLAEDLRQFVQDRYAAGGSDEQLGNPAEKVCACPTCKSDKVRARVWADVNDDKVISETEDDYWCDACESDGVDGTIPFSPGFLEIPRCETREWREALAALTKKEDECST